MIDNVVSIADWLKIEEDSEIQGTKYERGCPIFKGKVMEVSAQLMEGDEVFSLVDYMATGLEMPEPNIGERLLRKEEYAQEQKELLESKIRRAVVPFSVHPEMLNGSEVMGYITNDLNGTMIPTAYILQITKGKSRSGGDAFEMLAEMSGGTPHTGFMYIKQL